MRVAGKPVANKKAQMPDSSSPHLGPSLLPRYRICGLQTYAPGACILQWCLYKALAVTVRLTAAHTAVNGTAHTF
jgi:hypothetical protein